MKTARERWIRWGVGLFGSQSPQGSQMFIYLWSSSPVILWRSALAKCQNGLDQDSVQRKNQLFDPLYISQCIFNMMGWIKDHSICISHDDRHTNIPFLALKTLLMCFSVTGWTFPVHCSRRPDSQHVTALMEADYREASINLPLITTKREAALNSCEMAAAVRKWSPGKRPRTLVLLLPAAIVLIVNPA